MTESDRLKQLLIDDIKCKKEAQRRKRDNKRLKKKIQKELKKISRYKPIYNEVIPKYIDEIESMIHYAESSYDNMPLEHASVYERSILRDLERRINGIYAKINLDHSKIEYRKDWLTKIILICWQILSLFRG